MNEAIRTLELASRKVTSIESEIEVTRTSQFYSEFSTEGERMKDIAKLRASLRTAIDAKLTAIDTLVQMANAVKAELNTQLKELSLQKAA